MNLEENIIRIKEVMGVINEQTNAPIIVTGKFTATGNITRICDELHAFQSICEVDDITKLCKPNTSKIVGGMHTKVGDKLYELYKNGMNPKVTNVKVTVTGTEVSWTCTIEPSNDGKAWVGFTSRGAGCGDVVRRSVSKAEGKSEDQIKTNVLKEFNEKDVDFEYVDDAVHFGAGEEKFRQVFYRYTLPTKFPPHTSSKKSKPVIPVVPDSSKNDTINKPEPLKIKASEPVISVAPDSLKNDTIIKQEPLKIKALETTPNAIVAVANTIKRPDGDPYTYAKTASGDYLTYRCGKNKPCPDNINWINVTQGVRDNKKDYTTYESAIKTNIFRE
jgi:hypothetical protein